MSETAQSWLASLCLVGVSALGLACVRAGATRPEPAPSATPVAAPAAPAVAARTAPEPNPWADTVRSLLVLQCGRCHMPNRPTSAPRALLVFNLMDEPWYARMSPEQLDELARRVRGGAAASQSAHPEVEAFVRCAKGGSCDASP